MLTLNTFGRVVGILYLDALTVGMLGLNVTNAILTA